ncbi:MAG: chemotaxis protein CheD [Thermodesulfobacteriota bacterium]
MIKRVQIYLLSGKIAFSDSGFLIKTILGSCVSVCLWDSKKKAGAMNHFLLPAWSGRGLATPKYGNVAMEALYEKMIINGSSPCDLKAKIFGGARIYSGFVGGYDPGKENITEAIKKLEKFNIPVLSQDIGGNQGRNVIFCTDSGDVFVKKNQH